MSTVFLSFLIGLIFVGSIGCQNLNASSEQDLSMNSELKYNPRELIIRFQPETSQTIKDLLDNEKTAVQTGVVWLDKLNNQYHLMKVERLYPKKIDLEEIKKKFPERSKRISQNVDSPAIEDTYIFHYEKDIDLSNAEKAYAQNPQVIYVQRNQIITIFENK
ncbi:MAG: hypothetical protein H6755_06100 [Candidatus Omnitrophica bacterium]|nr:hypothetical protein [Candidatus Omnitrophota bacterium]